MPKEAYANADVIAGLDPAIHHFGNNVALKDGWPGHRQAKRRRSSNGYARP